MKIPKKFNNFYDKGFTLLELLVVIAVASILVSIAAASYSTAQKKARDGRRIGDMKAVQNAAEQYYADKGFYPLAKDNFSTQYLPNGFPTDPKGSTYTNQYNYVSGPAGCDNATTSCDTYFACSDLEDSAGGNKGSIINVAGLGFYCVPNLQ